MDKNIGIDGLTVNDRADMLAKAVGASRPRLAQMLMVDKSYFSTCGSLKFSPRFTTALKTIFEGLDVNWFKNGEGEFIPSKIVIPVEHLRLALTKNSPFKKLMEDPDGEEAAVQYIQDCGVDPISFANKYRNIYPALAKYGKDQQPENISQPIGPTQQVQENQSRTSHDTVADLLALTREQQKTIASMNDQIRDLQNVIINYIKWQNQPK